MINNIGFLITAFLRDNLLYKSVQSLIDNYFEGMTIVLIDQGHQTQEKTSWVSSLPDYCNYYSVPFDSGLSYGRNFGVQKAKELGCEYIVLGSDSFLFNESIKKLPNIIPLLNKYGLVGFSLKNSTCRWEGKLNLIEGQSFELDFSDPNNIITMYDIPIIECEIMKNFFIAKTETLLETVWDVNLLLGEHEDFMYRIKLQGFTNAWTKEIYAEKMNDRPEEYLKHRKQNFNQGIQKLLKKYNLKTWITYKNHQWCNILE